MGYTFTGWSLTTEEINGKIAAGETYIKVTPVYVQDKSKTYTVTVYVDGDTDGKQSETGVLPGAVKIVNAPEVEGKVFRCWTDDTDTILGYDNSYSMQVSKNVTMKAVYIDANTSAEAPKPVIAMTNVLKAENSKEISFSVTRDVPDGYTVIEHGMLYKAVENETELTLETSQVRKYMYGTTTPKGIFTLNVNVTGKEDTQVAACGYLIVQNAEGTIEIVYSKTEICSYNN